MADSSNEWMKKAIDAFGFGNDRENRVFDTDPISVFECFDRSELAIWSFHYHGFPSLQLLYDERISELDLSVLLQRVLIEVVNQSSGLLSFPSTSEGFRAYAEWASRDSTELNRSEHEQLVEAEAFFAASVYEWRTARIQCLTAYAKAIEGMIDIRYRPNRNDIKGLLPKSTPAPTIPVNGYFSVKAMNDIRWLGTTDELYDYLNRTRNFEGTPFAGRYSNQLRLVSAKFMNKADSSIKMDDSAYSKVRCGDRAVRKPMPNELVSELDRHWTP
jgi:hypothetical protein